MFKAFKDIQFTKENHKYTIWDFEFPISSTWRLHQFTIPFDSIYRSEKKALERSTPECVITSQDILDERSEKWRISTDEIWTPFHYYMECMLTEWLPKKLEDIFPTDETKENYDKNAICTKLNPKLEKILNRTNSYIDKTNELNLVPLASEVIVWDKKLMVAGMIDQLFTTNEWKIIMVDWKTSKEIKRNWYKKFMKWLFSKYPDANYYHYSLQLSLYKYIIEKNTDLEIDAMYIWHFSAEKENFKNIKCVDMTKEIHEFFETQYEF